MTRWWPKKSGKAKTCSHYITNIQLTNNKWILWLCSAYSVLVIASLVDCYQTFERSFCLDVYPGEGKTFLRTRWYLLNDIASCLKIYRSEYFESQLWQSRDSVPPNNDPTRWSLGQSVRRRLRNPYFPFGYFRLLSDAVLTELPISAAVLPLKAVCVLPRLSLCV
jgi:hypothetical protein